MTRTGWTGGEPEAAAPAMPLTERVLAMKQQGPGAVLETALARSRAAEARQAREDAAAAPDPDEYAANLVSRGYLPGMIGQLSVRLAETEAELAAEEAKIEKAAQRAARTRQMHERGQIDALGVATRWRDTDEGDEATVKRLQRRAGSLRRQIAEASELAVPPETRARNSVEEASARARSVLAEVAAQRAADDAAEAAGRAQLGRERAAFYAARGRRPFASRGAAARSEYCVHCTDAGVSDETSYLLHSDPELNVPVTAPDQVPVTVPGDSERSGRAGREITRVAGYNDDGVLGNHAPARVSYG
jgi:hypothetical protein